MNGEWLVVNSEDLTGELAYRFTIYDSRFTMHDLSILTNRFTKRLSCAALCLLSACGAEAPPSPPKTPPPVVESQKAQARPSGDLRLQMDEIARATQGRV